MSFRLQDYGRILVDLLAAPLRQVSGVAEAVAALEDGHDISMRVILRHDVDRRPAFAVRMAELEASAGVRSTYYFRCDSQDHFPERAIRTIAALGHETGYHYECLSRSKGDRRAALAQFSDHLARFRDIAPCITVAMHGAPLSRHSNAELLVGEALSRFGLTGDAVLSFRNVQLTYLTDTGGSWQAAGSKNFRDHVGIPIGQHPSPDMDGFAVWIRTFSGTVYVSTHPERWADGWLGFAEATLRDVAAGQLKRVLRLARRNR